MVKQKIERFEFVLVGSAYLPPKWEEIEEAIKEACGKLTIADKVTIEYLGSMYVGGDWEYHVKVIVEKNKSKLKVGHPISGYSIKNG